LPPRKPTHPVWRITKVIAGLCLLVLGIAGLFLPILQGVLFIFLALALLATESRRVQVLLDTLKRRHPGPWAQVERVKRRIFKSVGAEDDGEEEASGEQRSSREKN
jgi:uncharacterized protein